MAIRVSDLIKAMNLTKHRFGIEVELTAYVAKVRARIFKLATWYYPRTRRQGKTLLTPPKRAFPTVPALYFPDPSRALPGVKI